MTRSMSTICSIMTSESVVSNFLHSFNKYKMLSTTKEGTPEYQIDCLRLISN